MDINRRRRGTGTAGDESMASREDRIDAGIVRDVDAVRTHGDEQMPVPAGMTRDGRAGAADQDVRIDVSFPVAGEAIPADHGESLHANVARILGENLRDASWLAVHPMRGALREDGAMAIVRGRSALTLRLPPRELLRVLALAGGVLEFGTRRILLGTSRVYPIESAAALVAECALPDGGDDPRRVLAAVRALVHALPLEGRISVETINGGRTISVGDRSVVAHQVRVDGLTEDASLRLQYAGFGEWQRFGLGVFAVDHASR